MTVVAGPLIRARRDLVVVCAHAPLEAHLRHGVRTHLTRPAVDELVGEIARRRTQLPRQLDGTAVDLVATGEHREQHRDLTHKSCACFYPRDAWEYSPA